MIRLPERPLPAKPRHLEACNGCGLCCALEICEAGKIVYPEAVAPCPGLLVTSNRTYCRLVLIEQEHGLKPLLQKSLGIGKGCTMEDDDPA